MIIGSMIVKPARPGSLVPLPPPAKRGSALAAEGQRVPLSRYWLRLKEKGAVVQITEHPAPAQPKVKE